MKMQNVIKPMMFIKLNNHLMKIVLTYFSSMSLKSEIRRNLTLCKENLSNIPIANDYKFYDSMGFALDFVVQKHRRFSFQNVQKQAFLFS